jgi:transporter family protein
MTWLIFALLAPAVYAVVTFIDKYLLSKKIKDYNAMPVYTGAVGFLAGSILWTINGFPTLPIKDAVIVLTTGILTGISLYVYFKALSSEETSKINILFQMFPIISLALAFLLLHEKISIQQYGGFFLILFATTLISYENDGGRIKFSQAFFLILLYDFTWAVMGILMKYATGANSFWKVLNYESWGIGIGGILMFLFIKKIRKAFLKSIKKVRVDTLVVVGLNEGVFVIAKSLTFFAFSIGPAALVSVLETTQAVYAIIYGSVLTVLFPTIFHENISQKELVKKIVASLLVIMGIFLIYRQ